MKKYIHLLLLFISFASFGQSISIEYPTPSATTDNSVVNINYTTTGGASGPFTVKLYKSVTYMWRYSSCTYPNSTTEIVTSSSNSSPASLTLSSGLEPSGTTFGYIQCGQYFYNDYNKSVSYYFVVSNASVQSANYPVSISNATSGAAINSLSLSAAQICQGGTLNIAFQYLGINVGNTFTIEISDQNGSFTSPLASTTVAGNTATTASLAIPANAITGGGYKVRVSASDPVASFQTNLTIGVITPSISSSSSVCENSILNISTSTFNYAPESAYSFTWKKDNVNINANNQSTSTDTNSEYFTRNIAQSTDAGSYTLQISRLNDGCASATSTPLVLTISAAPATPTTSPLTVLSGNTATLTASNCTGTIYWYNSTTASESSYISSGTYTTPELTQQTTYYAACRQNSGSYCYSTRTPLVVSIDVSNAPNAPTLTASDNNFCRGSVSSPKLTATGCNGIVRWYSKGTNSSDSYYLQETDNTAPYELNISNSSTRYYAADCRENNVLSTSRTEVLINIKQVPNPPSISPSNGNINNGSTLTVTAYGCNGTVKWYADNTTTSILSTANPYTTDALVNNDPNNPAYFYLYFTCTIDGCESNYRNNSSYNVYNSLIAPPSISYSENTTTVCSGSTKTIYANGCSNGTVNWYDESTNGNLLSTGQSYTTPVMTYNNSGNNSYYYYVDCTIGGTTSSRSTVSVYTNRQPTTPSANQPTIACNATATLTATGCNTNSPEYFSVYWYASATATNYLNYGSTFTTPNLSTTTTYYVECSSGTCKSARVPITVTVGCTPPNAPVIASNLSTVCTGTGVNLTATGCANTVNWSDGGIGTSRMNVVFNTTITLTATCNNGLVSGNSNSITITVNLKPILVITNPAAVAPPNTVDITLSAITTGSTLPSGTTLSYHTDAGGTITLPNPATIAVSNTYYIKANTVSGCTDIKPVVVIISDCGTAIVLISTTDDYSSGTQLKKTNETITARNKVTAIAQATYRSNKSILLDTGFKAEPTTGGYFKTEIGGCN